ncbi:MULTISPECIES: PIN-like domain-containing protein [unclassified Pseudomonas]|uniref:PIN-like domain-containing protein n=1 Tax=unclassified Pseudomonas TaxID=196821 RepID=UPI000A1E61B2|nr:MULTISPECIES: PIN domain-containing protein [unclassified Pseudomonas]
MTKEQVNSQDASDTFNSYREKIPQPELIFSYKQNSIQTIKNSCLVSFDTNVLLAPYNLRKESINEIEKILSSLRKQNRIFLSAHAAREFAINKQNKLSEIHNSIHERKIKIKPAPEYPILFDLPEYELLNKHAEQTKKAIDEYNSALDSIATKIKNWTWSDPVVDIYSKVFSKETILDHKLTIDELFDDLKRRNKFKIAPGYKDASKEDNAEGDLSIWHTLLQVGADRQENIVFISEDRKPDWWTRSSGSAFTPKFELIHEFQNKTNGKDIHFLIFSEFLKIFEVPQSVVNDVKNEELRLQQKHTLTYNPYIRSNRKKLFFELSKNGIDISTCSVCGFQSNPDRSILEIHHITPRSEGGSDSADNIIVICPNCHKELHANKKNDF